MWLVTTRGFYSVVENHHDPDELLVRARVREDLESRGPVPLSEVEAEQKEMLTIVRRLADEGQIVLAGGADAQFV